MKKQEASGASYHKMNISKWDVSVSDSSQKVTKTLRTQIWFREEKRNTELTSLVLKVSHQNLSK